MRRNRRTHKAQTPKVYVKNGRFGTDGCYYPSATNGGEWR